MEELIRNFENKMHLERRSDKTIKSYSTSVKEFFRWFSDSYLNSKKSYEDQKANGNISTAKANSGESLVDKQLNAGKTTTAATNTKQPSQNQSSKTCLVLHLMYADTPSALIWQSLV